MSCRPWVMLIFVISQFEIKIMEFHSIEDCFYEKRPNTALPGYNDLHSHWLSDFDCFDRCLKSGFENCRSFEHWHKEQLGLCVRANISLADGPTSKGQSKYVDYYEIHCRKEMQVVRPSAIACPDEELMLTVKLHGVDLNSLLLGDSNCKPNWSNETHVQFLTHIDNCSLILTNDSIIGKLRWTVLQRRSNSVKHYERFFACRSNISQLRSTASTSTISDSKYVSSMLPNHRSVYQDEQQPLPPYRMSLDWTLYNRSYHCPAHCLISLYSFIRITLDDSSLISSKFLIDSCDLKALYPYANYVQSRQLIYQGCSFDPTVIHVPTNSSPLSLYQFSFYLYHILKEPIPFQIQCKIRHQNEKHSIQHQLDCSSSVFDSTPNDRLSMHRNDKRDHSYTLFRSSSVYVMRQLPVINNEQDGFPSQKSISSTVTVHYIECSLFCLFLFFFFIL